jgi:hypothetical protein
MYSSTLSLNLALDGGGVLDTVPRPLYPREKLVPIVQEAEWAHGPVWTGMESLAAPGFDSHTIQPVASHTNYAILTLYAEKT